MFPLQYVSGTPAKTIQFQLRIAHTQQPLSALKQVAGLLRVYIVYGLSVTRIFNHYLTESKRVDQRTMLQYVFYFTRPFEENHIQFLINFSVCVPLFRVNNYMFISTIQALIIIES